MKTWIKWTAGTVAVLIVAAASAVVIGTQLGERKRVRQVDVKVQPVAIASDPAALERGRYLYASRGCVDCHGANGGGRQFIDTADGLRVSGPNITSGAGSATVNYKPEDWVRTIRHGVKPNGQPAFIMPSEDYNRLTDADTGALIA